MELEDQLRRAAATAKESLAHVPIPDSPQLKGRWSRLSASSVAVLTAVVTLVLIGGTAWLVGDGLRTPEVPGGAPGVSPLSSSTLSTSSTETVTTTTTPVTQPEAGPLPPLKDLGDSLVFLSTDTHLTVVDVDSNEVSVHEVPELAGGDPIYRLVTRGDSIVFYGQTDSGPAVYALNPRETMSPKLVSEGWFFVPSARDDRLWVATLDPNSPDTVRSLNSVAEVTLDGEVVTGPVKPPSGRWPIGAVNDGLLFQTDTSVQVWDPITEEFGATLPGPFLGATLGNRILVCPGCAGLESDELRIVDLDGGSDITVAVPKGIVAFDTHGAFSEDGRHLAVIGREKPGPMTEQTPFSLVIIDLETSTPMMVPNSRTVGWGYPQVEWSSSRNEFFVYNNGQLLSYRPGDDTAQIVSGDLEGPYYGMATS